jgi:hypothetical protein
MDAIRAFFTPHKPIDPGAPVLSPGDSDFPLRLGMINN